MRKERKSSNVPFLNTHGRRIANRREPLRHGRQVLGICQTTLILLGSNVGPTNVNRLLACHGSQAYPSDLVEPVPLDEAYLDVTENKTGLPTATRVASTIHQQIRQELNLTASAGVAPASVLRWVASFVISWL